MCKSAAVEERAAAVEALHQLSLTHTDHLAKVVDAGMFHAKGAWLQCILPMHVAQTLPICFAQSKVAQPLPKPHVDAAILHICMRRLYKIKLQHSAAPLQLVQLQTTAR